MTTPNLSNSASTVAAATTNATNNMVNGTILNGSITTGIGTHTHTITSPHTITNTHLNPYNVSSTWHEPSLYIDINNGKKMSLVKSGIEIVQIVNGELKLNEVEKIELTELLSIFNYIKSDYPNVYADLILKGIIK